MAGRSQRLGRSGRARLLRGFGLYVPLRLLRAGLPAEERRRWASLRSYRRRYGEALARSPRPGSGPSVLFPNLAAALLVTHVHGLLARGLAERGARPLFLTFRDDLWREEYLRLYGHRDFVYVDDYLGPLEPCREQARELLDGCRTQDDVLALRVREAEVGRPAASRVLKELGRGSLDLDDRELRERLAEWLAASLWYAEAAERVYDDVRPDKQVAFEAFSYTPLAQFFDAGLRRGIDTLHWMRSPLEYSFLFRRYDWETRHDHFFSLTEETWREVRAEPWSAEQGRALRARLREMYLGGHWFVRKDMLRGKRLKSREELVAELGLDPAKKTAVIFSHVLFDATFWFGTSLFPDYGTWLVETVRRACGNPRVNWVVKMHPENVMRAADKPGGYELAELEEWRLLRRHFPELPPHVRLMLPENDTNPLSLFEIADWGLTVRGTVGLELPCFSTPVLTAGTGGYSGRGFTVDSATREEYLARLDRIEEIPPLDEEGTALAQRFTNAVFFRKPIPVESFRWQVTIGDEDALVFELLAGTPAELAEAPDLRTFAEWALDSSRRDLLLPARAPGVAEAPAAA